MDKSIRRIRGLSFALADLATALRASGRPVSADEIRILPDRIDQIPHADFLDETRSALQNVLICERDLPADVVGAVLDAMALIDQFLRDIG